MEVMVYAIDVVNACWDADTNKKHLEQCDPDTGGMGSPGIRAEITTPHPAIPLQ